MEIKKIDKDTFEYWQKVKTVKLSELKAELLQLQEQLKEAKPTNKELIELGRSVHPYYSDIEQKKAELQNQINKLRAL